MNMSGLDTRNPEGLLRGSNRAFAHLENQLVRLESQLDALGWQCESLEGDQLAERSLVLLAPLDIVEALHYCAYQLALAAPRLEAVRAQAAELSKRLERICSLQVFPSPQVPPGDNPIPSSVQ